MILGGAFIISIDRGLRRRPAMLGEGYAKMWIATILWRVFLLNILYPSLYLLYLYSHSVAMLHIDKAFAICPDHVET